jgi:hypothetical protein
MKHINITLTIFLFALQVVKGGTNDDDFINHRIKSPYQADSTTIRVLLPDKIVKGEKYKVLYILPVIENDNRRFGDGLGEVKKYNYHNKYNLICVAPEFTYKPWYCDHAIDKVRQDESHMLKTVIPFVDSHYPTLKEMEGRLLMGFSKSGRGALSLVLRNPQIFYKGAGWDNGIRVDAGPISEEERLEKIEEVFGTVSVFEKYRITNVLKEKGPGLGDKQRLFLYSTEGKRALGSAEIHNLMIELKIPHRYLFEPRRKHRWDSGWIPEAVRFLVDDYD